MNSISVLVKKVINKTFPIECIGCWEIGEYLCIKCKRNLEAHGEICPFCHKYSKWFKCCKSCKDNPKYENIKWIIIWFRYCGVIKKLLLKLKFFHKRHIAEFLAKRLYLNIVTNEEIMKHPENIIITFVSSHWYRHHFVKWYNQSQLIAENIGKIMNIPVIEICNKIKHTQSQTQLKRYERISNLKWAYSIICKDEEHYNDKTIIIVDDIMTTWSTLIEVANTIASKYSNCTIRWAVLGKH